MQKDIQKFQQFYDDYADRFFRYVVGNYGVSSVEAQDIVSDAFVKIRNNLEKYEEGGKFESWCWTILKNTTLDSFKKKKDVSFSTISKNSEIEFDVQDEQADVFEILNQEFLAQKIKTAISNLDEKYKDAIFHRFVENMDYAQIATLLGTTQDNIRQRISRGLKILKKNLEDLN